MRADVRPEGELGLGTALIRAGEPTSEVRMAGLATTLRVPWLWPNAVPPAIVTTIKSASKRFTTFTSLFGVSLPLNNH